MAQRLRIWKAMLDQKVVLCSDASAWDQQHSVVETRHAIQAICAVAVELRPAIKAEIESVRDAAIEVQGDKKVRLDDDSVQTLAGTLLSGAALTAFINTDGMRRAARIAIEGIANELGAQLASELTGKGDDLTQITSCATHAMLVVLGMKKLGVVLSPLTTPLC